MSALLGRLGGFCARHRWIVLGVWLLVVVAHILALRAFGDTTRNDLSLPGTDSQAATDLLASEFPPQQNGASPIVFHISTGKITDSANEAAVTKSVAAILKVPHVVSAPDPTANPQAGLVSQDGRTAFSSVLLDVGSGDLTDEQAQTVVDAAEPARAAGIEVEAGGSIGSTLSPVETESSELIGIIAAVIILTFTFGSLVAMGMPILMAVLGLLTTLGLVNLVGRFVNIPSTGPTLATMIGLGVGIDYALFLVTRHRDNLRAGLPVPASISNAVSTSGGAIVFAGSTVVIALLSLGVAGIPLVTALGLSTAIAVAVAVIAAITLLPALLSIVGARINALRLPRWLHPDPKPEGQGLWARWAALVTGHRGLAVLVALVILVPLSLPLLTLRLGQEDIGVTPTATTERRAFDLLANGFGPGYNGPLLAAVSLTSAATPSPMYTAQYDQATALKYSLTQQQAELTDQANELKSQQAALLSKQQQLTAQGDELTAQKKDLQRQAAELHHQQDELERQAASLRAQQAALEQQAADLQRQRAKLQRDRRALQAQARTLATRLVQLRSEAVRLDAQIAAATDPAERARLVAERRVVLDAIGVTRQQLRRVGNQAKALVTRARTLVTQAAALLRQASSLQSQAAALQQQADALQAEAVRLTQQSDALQQQADTLQRQADQLQQQADALQQQADALQAQQADAVALQGQAVQLQAQLTSELTKAGGNDKGTDPRLVTLQDALAALDGVRLVAPPNISTAATASTFTVIPTTRPADPLTAGLVVALRAELAAQQGTAGATVYVGGSTAANVDLADLITDKLALVILTVLVLSFLLLMVAFRSLLIPLQAAITNLLSVAAAFGVLTMTFQWGWGLTVVGLDSPYGTVPIASYVPLMMFAALFGLSMDYEVFFVSSVQHHHAAGDDVRTAVRRGLGSSARVIVAAAIIMISVFGSFILNPDPIIKQFGVGLSVAVALAGTMVILLAPALLALFGRATFWLPVWLGRLLPHVDLEGPPPQAAAVPAAVPVAAGPAQAGSAQLDAVQTGPVRTGAVQTDSEPTGPMLAHAGRAEALLADPEPTAPEPAEREPAEPAPAQPPAAEPVSVASEVAAPEVAGTPIDSEAALEGAGTRVDSEVALEAVGMPIDSEVAAAEGPGTRVDSEATLGAGGEVAGETRED